MIRTDLGIATAYAEAVSKGYTGTRDEFGQMFADFGKTAEKVTEDKKAVEQMKLSVEETKNSVDTMASEFGQNVADKTEEAKSAITEHANTEKESATAAISEAQTSATDAIASAKDSATAEITKKGADTLATIPEDYAILTKDVGSLKEDLDGIANQTMNVTKSKNLIGLQDGEYINAESQKRIKANVKNNVISVTSLVSNPPFGSRIFIPFSIENDIKTTLQVFCDYKVNNNFFVSIYNESKNEQLVAVSVTDNYKKSSTVNISKGNYFLSIYMGNDVLTEVYNSSIVVTLKCMMIDGTEASLQWEDPNYKKYEISTDEISKKIGVLKERPLFTTIESLWDTKLSMCVHGSDLYVGGFSGVSKYDLKNELAPELIRTINSENNFIESYGNSIPSMVVYNGFLYAGVRTSQAGFPSTEYVNGSIDIIKLDDFTLVSRNHINKKISRVSIYTKQDRVYLFVNLQMRGLHVYDVTNPESVLKIYDKDYPEGSSVHELQGGTFFSINEKDYYFATGFGDGFTIYDISDINNITEILYWEDLQKFFPNTHTFESVIDYPFVYMTIAPQHAYANSDARIQGILAVNISNLESLSYNLYEIPNEYKCKDVLSDPQPTQIRKRGDKLYINNSENGIAVFKIVKNGILSFDSILKTENYNEKVSYNAIASIDVITDGRIFVSDGKTLGKENVKVDLKQIRMYR
nr:MAG TPA: LVIVD repeat [Caudoviricetes sp.]